MSEPAFNARLPSEAVPLDDDAVPRRQVDLDEHDLCAKRGATTRILKPELSREDILKLPVENGGKFQSGLNLLNIWRDL